MCSSNKVCYRTRKIAKLVAKRATGQRGVKLCVYLCKECLNFHLSSNTRGQPFKVKINARKKH